MIEQLIVPTIDPRILDSIFEIPGRNDPCSCGSGEKYKRCCLAYDEEAWRFVAQLCKEADTACAMLRAMPRSIYPEYNPE